MKINTLELENVKRIKAVKIEPTANGLTVIGGKNGQGKTSVLDAIAWALGGDKFRPSDAQREGSVVPPHLKVTLDNGIIVERSGKPNLKTLWGKIYGTVLITAMEGKEYVSLTPEQVQSARAWLLKHTYEEELK